MADEQRTPRRSASTPIPGPSVSIPAYRQLQDQIADQQKAMEISSLKLEMLLNPLSAMMNEALAKDQQDSFNYQWKIQSLKTAGMPETFVNLCAAYQEFCDTRHNTPGNINIAELKGGSHNRSQYQQDEKPRHHRARSRSQGERQPRTSFDRDNRDRRRRRSKTPPHRGRGRSKDSGEQMILENGLGTSR